MANAILALSKDGQKIRDFEVKGEAWVGRSEKCGLRLDDRAISREHALVRVTPRGLEVVKKSQFGALIVNGAAVTSALVKIGDQIGLGPYIIEISKDSVGSLATGGATGSLARENSRGNLNVRPVESEKGVESEPSLNSKVEMEQALDMGAIGEGRQDLNLDANTGSVEIELADGEEPAGLMREATGSISAKFGSEGDFSSSSGSSGSMDPLNGDGATRIMTEGAVQARLEFSDGAANVTDLIVGQEPVVIGRGKNCAVILNDKKASRRHTLIERAGQKFIVRDLGSVNGTYVNEIKIEERELSGDDVLRIGDTEFRFKVLNLDFEKKQNQFLQVPQESDEAEPEVNADFALPQMAPPVDAAAYGAVPHGQPAGFAGMPGFGGEVGGGGSGSLLDKIKAMGPKKFAIRALIVVGVLWFLFDDSDVVKTPNKKGGDMSKRDPASKTPAVTTKLTYEKLSEEQKKFVIAQHDIGFEFYRNKEYDKALIEVRKIFELVDDYKDSREIERYSIEGKRKLEAMDEERRKEKERAELAAKIDGMKMQIQDLMTQKKFKEARDLFPQLQELDPENPMIGKWQAEIKGFYDDIEMAEKQKETVAAVNAAGWNLFRQASALKKRNQCRPAIKHFRTITDSEVNDRKLLAASRAGIQSCQAQIEDQVRPLMEEGKAAETAGEFAMAFQHYERVDMIDPGHKAAREGRDRIRGVLHERAKLYYTEAVVAESYSDFEQAKKKFEECLSTAPKDDIYHERARRKLNRFLRLEGSSFSGGGASI